MKRSTMAHWLILTLCIATAAIPAEAAAQKTKSKDTSDVRIVPFKDGYYSVDGPLLIMAKAGAEFEFGPQVEYKGKKFQIQKPISPNAYGVSSISVQFLSKTKEPSGSSKTLECDSQNWNEKEKTVDFHYRDDTIHVIVHTYTPAMGGFIIKGIECLSPNKDTAYTGTISQVGCVFDKTGVIAIIVTLAEHPKITFEIEPDYGVQKGFGKVLDIYKEQGMRATSGVMGAFYKATGLEGRKASLVCSKLQEDKCTVKSWEWRD